jgi:hypothetical protein
VEECPNCGVDISEIEIDEEKFSSKDSSEGILESDSDPAEDEFEEVLIVETFPRDGESEKTFEGDDSTAEEIIQKEKTAGTKTAEAAGDDFHIEL